MIKAVIIGFAHMHVNEIALYIQQQPETELVAIAGVPSRTEPIAPLRYTPDWNLENVRQNYCDKVYADYRKMLDIEKPDIAYILCEHWAKPEVVEECAKRHIDVSIEKPLAMDLENAKKIQRIVHHYGITAVVNWPVLWRPYLHKMKAALDSKLVGEPIHLRYINGHTGPLGKGARHRGVSANAEEMTDEMRAKTWWHQLQYGGGVFLDIACYGCLFSFWFLGDGAQSVLSHGVNLNTRFGDTEDNFAALVKYDGKMAVLEGTWTTPRVVIPSGPMVLCTDGVIICTGRAENAPDVRVYDAYGNEVEILPVEVGQEYNNMPSHYAHHVKTGAPIHEMLTLDKNVEMMALLDAIVVSARQGKEAKVCD